MVDGRHKERGWIRNTTVIVVSSDAGYKLKRRDQAIGRSLMERDVFPETMLEWRISWQSLLSTWLIYTHSLRSTELISEMFRPTEVSWCLALRYVNVVHVIVVSTAN
jgi:hypothetical protein